MRLASKATLHQMILMCMLPFVISLSLAISLLVFTLAVRGNWNWKFSMKTAGNESIAIIVRIPPERASSHVDQKRFLPPNLCIFHSVQSSKENWKFIVKNFFSSTIFSLVSSKRSISNLIEKYFSSQRWERKSNKNSNIAAEKNCWRSLGRKICKTVKAAWNTFHLTLLDLGACCLSERVFRV